MTAGSGNSRCELCQREVERLTVHHLIPRTRHRNRRNKREFDREDVRRRVARLCRPCHSHVHASLNEKELEREYNTVGALAAHPEIARFSAWIATKPDGMRVPVRRPRERTERERAMRKGR